MRLFSVILNDVISVKLKCRTVNGSFAKASPQLIALQMILSVKFFATPTVELNNWLTLTCKGPFVVDIKGRVVVDDKEFPSPNLFVVFDEEEDEGIFVVTFEDVGIFVVLADGRLVVNPLTEELDLDVVVLLELRDDDNEDLLEPIVVDVSFFGIELRSVDFFVVEVFGVENFP